MPQTTIESRQPRWLCEGQYATTGHRRVDGAVQYAKNGGVLLPFGRVAVLDPATNLVSPLAGAPAATSLLIVPIFTEKFGLSLSGLSAATPDTSSFGYPAGYENVEYMTLGDIVMWTEQAVNMGDPVFFRHTAGTAPNNIVGRVRKATVAGETPGTALTTARFAEATSSAGLVAVRIQTIVGL